MCLIKLPQFLHNVRKTNCQGRKKVHRAVTFHFDIGFASEVDLRLVFTLCIAELSLIWYAERGNVLQCRPLCLAWRGRAAAATPHYSDQKMYRDLKLGYQEQTSTEGWDSRVKSCTQNWQKLLLASGMERQGWLLGQ